MNDSGSRLHDVGWRQTHDVTLLTAVWYLLAVLDDHFVAKRSVCDRTHDSIIP